MITSMIAAQHDLIVIMIFVCIAVLMMFVCHKLFRPIMNQRINTHSDFSFSIHDTIATTLGAMIAFAMVEALSNYHSISTIVSNEASQINRLDRLLTRYGDHQFDHTRKDLIIYAQSIIDDEWPGLHLGERNPKTQKLWAPISREVININPKNQREASIYSDTLKSLESIACIRDDRIASASTKIPYVFWLAIVLLFLAKNILSSCYEGSKESDFALSIQTGVLATLVAVTFILNEPFIGRSRINPDPIRETIQLMMERTH